MGSHWTHVYQLLSRELLSLKRNPGTVIVDALVTHLVIGLLTGAFFWKVGSAIKSNYAGVRNYSFFIIFITFSICVIF